MNHAALTSFEQLPDDGEATFDVGGTEVTFVSRRAEGDNDDRHGWLVHASRGVAGTLCDDRRPPSEDERTFVYGFLAHDPMFLAEYRERVTVEGFAALYA